ncbi:PnuC-like nicotinamide riboside transporter [Gordonia phage Secretariat]|uniref:PnuC-like nicotinamide riboside transporter n=1 Tax=Gordonia phage Secretariat TaxID=2725616 RepID=A0A6M3SUN5_9CAUD|nr:PnuC-like nicotinamide riboside transporter [Gordonia phage Secretariat]QJD49643.1 PnuC-like nicotinamide riboside transporter [Gordonia phage Secretariat]
MWWSWILAIIGMTGVYLTTQKKVIGFGVGLFVQTLWVAYAIATEQYGFILSALGFGVVNTLGLIRWGWSDEEVSDAKSPEDS